MLVAESFAHTYMALGTVMAAGERCLGFVSVPRLRFAEGGGSGTDFARAGLGRRGWVATVDLGTNLIKKRRHVSIRRVGGGVTDSGNEYFGEARTTETTVAGTTETEHQLTMTGSSKRSTGGTIHFQKTNIHRQWTLAIWHGGWRR